MRLNLRCKRERCTLIAIGMMLAVGCTGRPARVYPPGIDPKGAAAKAIELYDADGNGVISRKEAESAPAIRDGWRGLDGNKDDQVAADEIASRLAAVVNSKVGVISVACAVRLDGQPLADADVLLEPAPFLGSELQSAKGHTDSQGLTYLQISREIPGVQCGYYQVRVSKQSGGKEIVPRQYNEDTKLGLEVWLKNDWPNDTVPFNLTSR